MLAVKSPPPALFRQGIVTLPPRIEGTPRASRRKPLVKDPPAIAREPQVQSH